MATAAGALGQQVTAEDSVGVCFGKAVEVRERGEREANTRGSSLESDKTRVSRWEERGAGERRPWTHQPLLEDTMHVLQERRCEMHGKGHRTQMCFVSSSVRFHSRNPCKCQVKEWENTAYTSSAPWIAEFTPRCSPGGWWLVTQCGKRAQGWLSSFCSVTKWVVTGTVVSAPALLTEICLAWSRELLPSTTHSQINPLGSYFSQNLHFSNNIRAMFHPCFSKLFSPILDLRWK